MSNDLGRALEAYRAGDLATAMVHAEQVLAACAGQGDGPGSGEAPAAHMLLANLKLKTGDKLAAADHFAEAAIGLPARRQEFLTFAARLYLALRRPERLAAIVPAVAEVNRDDADLLAAIGNSLLAAGIHHALDALVPLLDLADGRHLQVTISHYQLTRRPEKLAPIIEGRYREQGQDSFVAMNYFAFCRSSLMIPGARAWLEMAEAPDDPLVAEIILRDQPLSRRYWSDDEAIHARPSGAELLLAQYGPPIAAHRRAIRPATERLRIGYVSSDYTIHATMFLLYDVFLAHDRDRFEITLFCHTHADQAGVQAHWHPALQREIVPIRDLDDTAAAGEISRRGIDILVDLKGQTTNARLGLIRQADAPVKATYIGYPGSVRGADLDYHITDRIVTRPEDQVWFEERLCRLPECYQGNCSQTKHRLRPTRRADHGLPEAAFVFASFNSPAKISPGTIDLWMAVLQAVPDSVFWILCPGALLQANLAAELFRLGLAPERLIFAEAADYAAHIDRVGLADLALDTFPYNGHTTTSDLLWGGLPVLTKRGRTFAARVSESLLTAIGLPDLVARDEADFVALAQALAQDRERLAEVKARLLANRTTAPLFDTQRFTRHLEQAYAMMAERARAGLAPAPLDVPALAPRNGPFLHL